MSTRYTIVFQNNHGSEGDYSFFVDPPEIAASGTSSEVFTNTWISKHVKSGGRVDISTTQEMFAWAGTVPQRPSPGVSVRGGVSRPALLGYTKDGRTIPGSTFDMIVSNGEPDLVPATDSAALAAYKIDTRSDFSNPNTKYMIGLGKIDGYGLVSPVASTLAMNNMSTNLTPIMKFYVSQSSYQAGQIVDFQSVSKKAGVVDFSKGPGAGNYVAVVIHNDKGEFDVVYHQNYKGIDRK